MTYEMFIGRQPIYDEKLELVGYELLFGNNNETFANITDPNQATSQVLNAIMETGLEQIVGKQKAFINVTPEFLLGEEISTLEKEKIVLELTISTKINKNIIDMLEHLSKKGYTFALDNFIYQEDLIPLLKLADIVKLNVHALNCSELRSQFDLLRKYSVTLVAEKVESQEDFRICDELGFDYFQGYFLTQPQTIKKQRLPACRLTVLQLLAKLQNPQICAQEVEDLVNKDVFLSYRLLRYMNSAHVFLPKKIDSVKQAMLFVGLDRLKVWVSLIALSNIDDKPQDLLVAALSRAKMCELLAASSNRKNTDSYFIVGMFSVLDAIMDTSMEELIGSLNLIDEIADALLFNQGNMGEALLCILAYERGHWSEVGFANLDTDRITACYLQAIEWSHHINDEVVKQ